ncbi:hypothetical protein [Micromonospora sp. LOL_021]|uniref:hypothetical protein n=1 Tax=Micromonospora sp. LOL_021 TaxID=3345417 RepID=UPI003A84BE07
MRTETFTDRFTGTAAPDRVYAHLATPLRSYVVHTARRVQMFRARTLAERMSG